MRHNPQCGKTGNDRNGSIAGGGFVLIIIAAVFEKTGIKRDIPRLFLLTGIIQIGYIL